MKKVVIALTMVICLVASAMAARTSEIPVNFKGSVQQVLKETGREIFTPVLSKKTAPAVSSYSPVYDAVLVDSSKNGFGLVSGITNPISHNGETFVLAYRQWAGLEATSGLVGMAVSQDAGDNWTISSNLNAASPALSVGRYPSAIGAGTFPFIVWSEYVGESTGLESDAKPMWVSDRLGWGGGYLGSPMVLGNDAVNPEGMWMGCPNYSEAPDGTGHLNLTFTTWREFDDNDVSSHNSYQFKSSSVSASSISFNDPVKILDARTYFEEGSSDGSTTSDAFVSINDNGVGYVSNVAYWGADYTSLVDNNAYHTFKFRKTTDYGETWSTTSFDTDVPYYFVKDNIFDDNIFDIYIASQQFEVVTAEGDTTVIDSLTGTEIAVTDTLNYPGLFIGYDNDMIVDQNGGVHFMCLVIPESEESGFIMPTVQEGCGFYHLYCADPASETAEWKVSFVASMQETWQFYYGKSSSAWQQFFPCLAVSSENPDVMYVVYNKGNIYEEDETLYMKSYDIYVRRSQDAGVTWEKELNVTNTDNFDEIDIHADPDATDDHIYLVYQVPDYDVHTVDADTSDAVPEDYKNRVYFMDVNYSTNATEPVAAPAEFKLEQNYPNPFNPLTTISYNVSTAGSYSLTVYNTLGQKVVTLQNGYLEAGSYSANFDAAALSSGIYFYELSNGQMSVTKKSVLLK